MEFRTSIRTIACLLPAVFVSGLAFAQAKLPWSGMDLSGDHHVIEQGPDSFGPYDYTNPSHVNDHLGMVERFHFTSDVEQLIRGKSGTVYGDLAYTIRAFPNHHRALYALVQYQLKDSGKVGVPPECWLERSLVFSPGDKVLYSIFGIYLYKLQRYELAIEKYAQAENLPGDNSEIHYNMGLLYIKMNDLPKAQEYAEKAYAAGYPLEGLRRQLGSKGYTVSARSEDPARP